MKTLFLTFALLFGFALNAQSYSKYNSLLNKYVTSSGKVNYAGIKQNKAALDAAIAEIDAINPRSSWSKNDKLAYYINLYNLYTLKLVADNYPVKSIKNISGGKPWDKNFIPLGGKKVSLNHIEHGILRKLGDPRIHFGVNCASISCPIISNSAFTSSNVQGKLDALTKKFVNDSRRNKLSATSVQISPIFDWFESDFKGVIAFLNKYSSTRINSSAKISYLNYNWNLNK